jgi:hypothetical protein
MRRQFVHSSSIVVTCCFGTALIVSGCSSTSTTSGTPNGPAPDGGIQAETGALSITPAAANVLTCSTVQFHEVGGAGGGIWTASAPGTIDPKGGLYTAPTTTSAGGAATIAYAEGTRAAIATIQLGTAFLGPVATVPIGMNDNAAGAAVPFEHTFTANGARVYTAVPGPSVGDAILEADVYVSNDSGATFAPAAQYHTGTLTCVTIAADAGDPDVAYMVYYAGHGDSTSNTGATVRLAVSQDGAKTFPVEYIVADSVNSMADFICPDVVSPSPDHVIVTGILVDGTSAWAGTFASDARGKDIGAVGTEGTAGSPNPAAPSDSYAGSDTNAASAQANCAYNDNGNGYGPRVFANGAGTACVAYTGDFGSCNPSTGFFVQCSADNGATWTPRLSIATPTSSAKNALFGAVSKGGNVALTWLDTVSGSDEVMIAISKDGGKTFGDPIQYPSTVRAAAGGDYTFRPVVTWETDDILWLSQTIDGSDTPFILVDKTCDFGASWSGAVNAGVYEGTSLLSTSAGMLMTGYDRGHTTMVAIPLASED